LRSRRSASFARSVSPIALSSPQPQSPPPVAGSLTGSNGVASSASSAIHNLALDDKDKPKDRVPSPLPDTTNTTAVQDTLTVQDKTTAAPAPADTTGEADKDKDLPEFPELPEAPAPRIYGHGWSATHKIPNISGYSDLQKQHAAEADEYARIVDARNVALGNLSDVSSSASITRLSTPAENEKNADGEPMTKGEKEKQRLMDQMNAGKGECKPMYSKHTEEAVPREAAWFLAWGLTGNRKADRAFPQGAPRRAPCP
jgi:hypothetical protein